ncbi:S41 family peptidase [Chitinophaga lutea]
MRTILTACFFFFHLSGLSAQPDFSRDAMLEDFRYMERALKECHPGLYRYQTKGRMDSLFRSTEEQIRGSMPQYDYYALLSQLVAEIRCAHTVITPRQRWEEILFKEVKHFPYQVFFIRDKAYLTVNRTRSREIKPGAELLSINGMPVDTIREVMFRHLPADGYNRTLKGWQIDNLMFSYYYHLLIGRPDTFRIRYRNPGGTVKETVSLALSIREIDRNNRKNPLNRAVLQHYPRKSPQRFEIDTVHRTGIITLRQFFGGATGEEARGKLGDFMQRAIRELEERNIPSLVIDLRNNPGGYDSQGQELLSWLIAEPVTYYERLHTVTKNSPFLQYSSVSKEELAHLGDILHEEPDGTFTISETFNAGLRKVQPAAGHFKGNICFLVNGATGSATAEFTAIAKYNRVGKFIGEETGGSYEGGNGNEFIGLVLPRTKLQLTIPLVYYRMAVGQPTEPGRGTLPDFPVSYSLEDVMTGKDPYLERALVWAADFR